MKLFVNAIFGLFHNKTQMSTGAVSDDWIRIFKINFKDIAFLITSLTTKTDTI